LRSNPGPRRSRPNQDWRQHRRQCHQSRPHHRPRQAVKPTSGFDVAVASLSVGGDVRFARILAGFDAIQSPADADASIGPVTVGGDWVASILVAGAEDSGFPGFGIGDVLQTVGDTPLVARIVSITIKGDATGSTVSGDHFGFVAQQIGGLKIGGRTFALSAAKDNILIPFNHDLHLLEVGWREPNKAAGAFSPPSKVRTGPASSGRLVCAPER
jgi:hypothetical protein